MKRILLCMFLVAAMAVYAADDKKKTTTTTTTTSTSKDSAAEDTIKKNERSLWDAWKNHDNKPFNDLLADDGMILDTPPPGSRTRRQSCRS